MRAIVTVYGVDRVGIICGVTTCLAKYQVNILDISQTVMQEFFTMTMLADTSSATASLDTIREALEEVGASLGVSTRIQSEEIFNAMHKI